MFIRCIHKCTHTYIHNYGSPKSPNKVKTITNLHFKEVTKSCCVLGFSELLLVSEKIIEIIWRKFKNKKIDDDVYPISFQKGREIISYRLQYVLAFCSNRLI